VIELEGRKPASLFRSHLRTGGYTTCCSAFSRMIAAGDGAYKRRASETRMNQTKIKNEEKAFRADKMAAPPAQRRCRAIKNLRTTTMVYAFCERQSTVWLSRSRPEKQRTARELYDGCCSDNGEWLNRGAFGVQDRSKKEASAYISFTWD